MDLANFGMFVLKFLNKDPDIAPEEAPRVILDTSLCFVSLKMVIIPSTQVILIEEYIL